MTEVELSHTSFLRLLRSVETNDLLNSTSVVPQTVIAGI
jgi:hypothetical protein